MIWLTSLLKPLGGDSYLANKRNMVKETLAVIFLFQGEILQILDNWHQIQLSTLSDQ